MYSIKKDKSHGFVFTAFSNTTNYFLHLFDKILLIFNKGRVIKQKNRILI